MNQKKSPAGKTNEKDLENGKFRKSLIIIFGFILFGGITYGCFSLNKIEKVSAAVDIKKPAATVSKKSATKLMPKKINKAVVSKLSEKNKAVSNKKTGKAELNSAKLSLKPKIKEAVETINPNNPIKPADKMALAKLAYATAGKKDPFSGGSFVQPGVANFPYSFNKGILPPPPSNSGLPTIGNIPDFVKNVLPSDLTPVGSGPVIPKPEPVILKGFIGNKVIVSVNGVSESLGLNESFQGVKVIKVDPANLTAKFEKDGKILTKSVKSLAQADKVQMELVKYINK